MLFKLFPGRSRLTAALLALAIFLLSSCDPRQRHQTLAFFFTGVAPLEEGVAKEVEKPAPDRLGPKPPSAPTVILSAHSYFSQRKCGKCHPVTKPVGAERSVTRQSQPTTVSAAVPSPTSVDDLGICVNCHHNPFTAAGPPGGKSHAPVACTICHLPHQSEYPHLLRNEAPKVCAICHQHEKLAAIGFHKAPLRSDSSE
jgi:predicted CXXCH cytochrome family protein